MYILMSLSTLIMIYAYMVWLPGVGLSHLNKQQRMLEFIQSHKLSAWKLSGQGLGI